MITVTTHTLDGHPIQEYIGIVAGETIIGANVFKDIAASIRDIVGGRSGAYEKTVVEARQTAIAEMQSRAQQMGANAIVGVRVDFETVGNSGSMLMIQVTGTAVKI